MIRSNFKKEVGKHAKSSGERQTEASSMDYQEQKKSLEATI